MLTTGNKVFKKFNILYDIGLISTQYFSVQLLSDCFLDVDTWKFKQSLRATNKYQEISKYFEFMRMHGEIKNYNNFNLSCSQSTV